MSKQLNDAAALLQLKLEFQQKKWRLVIVSTNSKFGKLALGLKPEIAGDPIELAGRYTAAQLGVGRLPLAIQPLCAEDLDDKDRLMDILFPSLDALLVRFAISLSLTSSDQDVMDDMLENVVTPARLGELYVGCEVSGFANLSTQLSKKQPLHRLLGAAALSRIITAATPAPPNQGNRRELFP